MAKNDYRDVHTMVGADAVIQGNVTCQGGLLFMEEYSAM